MNGRLCRKSLAFMLLLALASIGWAGCAREPTGPTFSWAPPPLPERGRIYVYRSDPRSSGSTVSARLDGQDLGHFRDGEYDTLEIPAGLHRLQVRMRGLAFLSWGWNTHQFRVQPGETVYLGISVRLEERGDRFTPPPPEIEVSGWPEDYASKNVFIQQRPRTKAAEDLITTRRRTDPGSGK